MKNFFKNFNFENENTQTYEPIRKTTKREIRKDRKRNKISKRIDLQK